MAILPIVQTGEEVLRKKCVEVVSFDKELHNLLNDMKDTLKNAQGAGLAAPQVGVSKRIFIIDVENEGIVEFVNPVVLGVSGSQYGVEGCLSVKGKWGDVKRPRKVTVEAYDRYGNKFKYVGRDFTAKALSHEYDHLDGILYTDKANNLRDEV